MAQRDKSRFWRIVRVSFRRFRITLWLVILTLLCCLLYLNQIGLPDFIKHPLQEKLRARGLDLEFTRMRWRWMQGIVAENVRFGRADQPMGAQFSVREARVELDYRALARFQLQVNALLLRRGELSWEFGATDGSARKISLEDIQTELRFLPDDRWELDHFQARFAGARLRLVGTITNASAVRDWKFLRQRTPAAPGSLERRLRLLAETLDRIQFSDPPELNLDIRGDARDLVSFTIRLNVNTPGVETPWAAAQNVFLTVLMLPERGNAFSRAEIRLEAGSAKTRWAGATNVHLQLNLLSALPATEIVQAHGKLSADGIETPWARARQAILTAQWTQSITNPIPLSGWCELRATRPHSEWADASDLVLKTAFEPAPDALETTSDWAGWAWLAPYHLKWDCDVQDLRSPRVEAQQFACAGGWEAPRLTLSGIHGTLYQGSLDARAGLDVVTREFTFQGSSDFDVLKISPLLTQKSRDWLGHFAWNRPPKLQAAGALQLPAWTNLAHADWHGGVRPTLRLDGQVEIPDGSYRGIQFSAVNSHFSYTNLLWRLPDLVARRPEGQLRMALVSSEATRDYHFKIFSTLHPLAIKPLLETNQHRIFDLLGFGPPPVIDGEIWGRWYAPETIGARARLAVTNFSIRGESFGDLVTGVEYTNLFVRVIEPRAHRGTIEHGSATSLDIDIRARKIYLTNAVGVADPGAVTRAVGPKVGRLMAPYHFVRPVSGRVEGVIPMHDERDADLHFDLEGGPFEWWRFKLPHLSGRVDWVGENLVLTNLQADFYGGRATGNAWFDFQHREAVDFRFDAGATDADLQPLMIDLTGKTNALEGLLAARISITEGNLQDLSSLQGRGRANLRDGLIWEIPIFGVLSPALDSIVPGLGSSRANEGSATFVITNGVARTDDLEIRASIMRLQYEGTVDWKGGVNARVQAELLRDMWGVGRVLGLALWPVSKIFEYKITGSLQAPKTEPVYLIPKIVLIPFHFHPIRTLKELVPESSPKTPTNSPPGSR